jgi:hypothetical protein
MAGPEVRLHTLRRAIHHFRDTPGRQGRLVALRRAEDVLVAGDLHGNLENFRRLLLTADLARHPQRHLVLQEVIHGPFHYPAGGDKSHQLLDLVAALKCQYPRQVHFLLGNHELAQFTGRRISKNDLDLNALFREGVGTAYLNRAAEIYDAYLELFTVVPLAVRTANRVFLSHSLPHAGRLDTFDQAALQRDSAEADLLPGGAVHSLVWGRDVRPDTVAAFLQRVDAELLITGHIPCEAGFERPSERHLILDSMAAPAACCLFPADRPLTGDELAACVRLL